MNKKMSWLDKPITWRASLTASLVSMGVMVLLQGGYYAWEYVIPSIKKRIKPREIHIVETEPEFDE